MEFTDPPWEPPLAGSEVDHLIGSLDRLRWTFRWKSDGLDRAGLTTRVGDSTLTLGGLLKHLAVCEDVTFSWKLAGEPPVALLAAPEDSDDDWQFSVMDDDSPESLYVMWDEAVDRSRERFARALKEGGLDQHAHLAFEGCRHVSVRRLVFDLVRSTADTLGTPTSFGKPWTAGWARIHHPSGVPPTPRRIQITERTERTTVDSDQRQSSHASPSMKATVTVSPACLPMAVLMSALTGSLWVPSPSAISEV